jgi:hypothetical protein
LFTAIIVIAIADLLCSTAGSHSREIDADDAVPPSRSFFGRSHKALETLGDRHFLEA